ncbi:redox-regulated ATPase YchF [Desulfurococcus amylolyticus]|uniref:Putative GTPase, probable translation factor n=1 Tax=Desulfurococcus amylolyticus DSM 16532 TaxID=768672 RepID=I3XTL8_DESAM|nr:redox-regulated ATPase YchF [Desulfurococcus amylolyticus]AFL67292.1 putative GTPase, probable translation factor [Desulfurococcus amylolyticus DSM 16532]
MPPPEKIIGIVGKTNVGKSTLFSVMTLLPVKIANHPFTTIEPNIGVGHVRVRCAHTEIGLPRCDPRAGFCISGERFIPVKIIDVAGLIPGASMGRGLGNKFMDDLRQADVLIHVVDASGSTDLEGNPAAPGTHDPVEEAENILHEINEWFKNIITRIWESKISRFLASTQAPLDLITQNLSGLSVRRQHVIEAIKKAGLEDKPFKNWSLTDVADFAVSLREVGKPILIAANKIDIPVAVEYVRALKKRFGEENVVPVSALGEYILRKAGQGGLIEYIPGDPMFRIKDSSRLTSDQLKVLKLIEDNVLKQYGSTGVQQLLNHAVFRKLGLIVVYPVEDENKFTDHHGNILPDAYLVPRNTTARELAYMIHTELGEGFLYAVNARSKRRIGEDYVLENNDIIKIVAVKSRSS